MSDTLKKAIGHLPTYWKLASIRCCIYAFVVSISAFDSGVEGYNNFSDMSTMEIWKLILHMGVAAATTWVAFLDQSIQKIDGTKVTDSVTVSQTHSEQSVPQANPISQSAEPLNTSVHEAIVNTPKQ